MAHLIVTPSDKALNLLDGAYTFPGDGRYQVCISRREFAALLGTSDKRIMEVAFRPLTVGAVIGKVYMWKTFTSPKEFQGEYAGLDPSGGNWTWQYPYYLEVGDEGRTYFAGGNNGTWGSGERDTFCVRCGLNNRKNAADGYPLYFDGSSGSCVGKSWPSLGASGRRAQSVGANSSVLPSGCLSSSTCPRAELPSEAQERAKSPTSRPPFLG